MKQQKQIQDSWLLEQYRMGHTNAMTLLVKRWHAIFCNQAYFYTKDRDIAKDIAQETWITIINKMDNLHTSEKFGSWGMSIVTRKSIDWYRKKKRTFEKQEELFLDKEQSIFEEENQNKELSLNGKLLQAIKALSEEQQLVIRLFYIESYGLIEISEILKIPKGTVKSRLYYAREQLKIIIK